jgi:hypothetical protein
LERARKLAQADVELLKEISLLERLAGRTNQFVADWRRINDLRPSPQVLAGMVSFLVQQVSADELERILPDNPELLVDLMLAEYLAREYSWVQDLILEKIQAQPKATDIRSQAVERFVRGMSELRQADPNDPASVKHAAKDMEDAVAPGSKRTPPHSGEFGYDPPRLHSAKLWRVRLRSKRALLPAPLVLSRRPCYSSAVRAQRTDDEHGTPDKRAWLRDDHDAETLAHHGRAQSTEVWRDQCVAGSFDAAGVLDESEPVDANEDRLAIHQRK